MRSRFPSSAGALLERRGQVVECRGETVVRFPAGCGIDPEVSGAPCCCGAFARPRQIPLTRLDGGESFRPGEWLTLEFPVHGLTRLALMVFAAPLAALLLGAWLGVALAGPLALAPDTTGAITGLGCLAGTSVIVACGAGATVRRLKLTARRQRTIS